MKPPPAKLKVLSVADVWVKRAPVGVHDLAFQRM